MVGNREKKYDGDTHHVGHCGWHQSVGGICVYQYRVDADGHCGWHSPVVGAKIMITSRGMFMAAIISAVYSLHNPDLVYLFYSLLFCALGIFLEGYESGSK